MYVRMSSVRYLEYWIYLAWIVLRMIRQYLKNDKAREELTRVLISLAQLALYEHLLVNSYSMEGSVLCVTYIARRVGLTGLYSTSAMYCLETPPWEIGEGEPLRPLTMIASIVLATPSSPHHSELNVQRPIKVVNITKVNHASWMLVVDVHFISAILDTVHAIT